ncbi:hypothetical protein E2C01_093225 [Portunus trituberculatus]|uniref:Uncharacterized protein n=1 Tax=Portunus trituberculatus TaxID=210409 RepID=A0A5B7JXJ6_PORTR|nr:hypothetical protein [Portunus trituberculatus]
MKEFRNKEDEEEEEEEEEEEQADKGIGKPWDMRLSGVNAPQPLQHFPFSPFADSHFPAGGPTHRLIELGVTGTQVCSANCDSAHR